jgi:hypothetical protein
MQPVNQSTMIFLLNRQTTGSALPSLRSRRIVNQALQLFSFCWLAACLVLFALPAVAQTASAPDLIISVPNCHDAGHRPR